MTYNASYLSKQVIIFWALLFLFLFATPIPTAMAQDLAYPILSHTYSSIRVFDNQGRFVGRILPERRYWAPLDRIPPFLQKAVVAVEDSRFYEHSGVDIRGIARALVKDVVKRKLVEGGSTITQQLIKNKYLSGEKTLERKLTESRMAIELEQTHTKRQILEMYFNEIYFGNGAWGIVQAARLYFDKNPEDLTDAECSLLAGTPKSPAHYNPLGKPENVMTRRDVVLKRMADLNIISRKKQQDLRKHPPTITPPAQGPYYLAHIKDKLIGQFGPNIIERGGLEITTAMNLDLQKLAERTLSEQVKSISPQLQGAMISLDPATGDILAMTGGTDYLKSPYNRALSAKRQPGSAIKPLIYAAALEKGYTASSIWDDKPVGYSKGNGEIWKPQNYGKKQFGELSMRQALAHSNNVIAVKTLDAVGIPFFQDFVETMGLQLRKRNDLSLALGTEEVSLRDLTLSYIPLINGGMKAEPRSIIRIYDRTNKTWTTNPPELTPAISPDVAYITTQMLRDVMTYGTAKALKKFAQARPSAGKTGTTDDYRDAWFVGYTPQMITGVWVGHDKPRPGGPGFTGGAVAAPIWQSFMSAALTTKPIVDFQQPDSVVSVAIDPATGFLASPDCPAQRDEFYAEGTQPTDICPLHEKKIFEPVSSSSLPIDEDEELIDATQ